MPRKFIPLPLNSEINFEKIYNFIDNNFCKYIYKRGKYENQHCYIKKNEDKEYCKKHQKMIEKINKNYIARINKPRCLYITKNGKCNRKNEEDNDHYCKYHKPLKLKLEPVKYNLSKIKIIDDLNKKIPIVNNLQMIIYKPNHIKEKLEQMRLLYKKNKKKLKKLKYKKNRKNKINNPDKNKVIKIKENLFKEDNIYYTYNFYDIKVIADNINGIECIYCNTKRYTESGPCTYQDCFNRSFDDYVFKKYYKIHNKHKISIYNKLIKNSL